MAFHHTHSFSVDTACECGIMLSDYTRQLKIYLADTMAALEKVTAHGGNCAAYQPSPMGSGESYKFVGCSHYHSSDPLEYCLRCEAIAVLAKVKGGLQ